MCVSVYPYVKHDNNLAALLSLLGALVSSTYSFCALNNLIFIVIVIIVIAFGEAFRCVANSIGF